MAQTTCGYDLMRYWSRRMIPEDEGVLLARFMITSRALDTGEGKKLKTY